MPKKKEEAKSSGKVSFKNDFCSDLFTDEMLFAATVRSPIATGIITSISTGNLPDGYYLFTAKDVPGNNFISTVHGRVPVFCDGNISYKGEPIGLLVGPDERILSKLLGELVINYDEKPIEAYLKDIQEDTHKPDAQLFFPSEIKRKVNRGPCFFMESGKVKGIDAVIAEAAVTTSNSWLYNLTIPYYREPCGSVCTFDSGTLTVNTPSQWINNLRESLCSVLNLQAEDITINRTKGFDMTTNSIWYNSIIACQTAVASYRTQKPVKLIYSREEQNTFIDCMKPIQLKYTTACTEEGKLSAIKAEIELDVGSLNVFANEIVDRLTIAACGCYRAENISIQVTAHQSGTPPMSVDFQMIDSAAFFAIENQITDMGDKLDISPADIRKINLNTGEEDSPAFTFPLKGATQTIDALVKYSAFSRRFSSYRLNSQSAQNETYFSSPSPFSAPLRGIGFACAFEGSFYYGSEVYGPDQELEVTAEKNGSITIHSPPISTPVKNIWTKLAADVLGISHSQVKFNSTLDDSKQLLMPETVYANISIMTTLLQQCCEIIKKKDKSSFPYTVCKKMDTLMQGSWDSKRFNGQPFHSCSFACASVELEFDPCIYTAKIKNITVVINGGKILNSNGAIATVQLGIQKILSALVEDDTVESDNIHVSFLKSDAAPEQIGELVYQIIPAAYIQAISQALGCSVNFIPLNIKTIYDISQIRNRMQEWEAVPNLLDPPEETTAALIDILHEENTNADNPNAQ